MGKFLKSKKNYNIDFLDCFMFFSPFLIGVFFEWTACLCSVVFISYLIKKYYTDKKIEIPLGIPLLSYSVIFLGYVLSDFWAIDSYAAFFGVLKFMPIVLFYLVISQDKGRKKNMLRMVPYSGAFMTILAFCLKPVKAFHTYFYNADRLTGFFQYANTYALFLLIGIILILFSEKISVQKIIVLLILLLGIFESGSRTVFVLTILSVLIISVCRKEIRKTALISFGSVLIIVAVVVMVTHNVSTLGRFLTTSLTDSSLLGRLLYYKDGISVIAKHPFGIGYMGYYYYQSEIQTGRYIVKFIHNDFLQMMIDIGIIPAGLFMATIVKSFFSKEISVSYKFIIAVIAAHCLLDFDLQFLTIFFILIAAMYSDEKRTKVIKQKNRSAVYFMSAAAICFCMYFCIALGLDYIGQRDLSYKMYPYNTEIEIEYLREADSVQKLNDLSKQIIKHNKNVALAYDAQARVAQADGKYEQMIVQKEAAIRVAKYNVNEYYDYFRMLRRELESRNKDIRRREACAQSMLEIPELMKSVEKQSDPLAWRIEDKPNLVLKEEMADYIQKIKNREMF